jgi:hypothetical protein
LNRAKRDRNEEREGINRNARIETEIDQILAGEEELMPSSGFLGSVMDRVRQEAALPAPIPFPWKLAVPGILLAGGVCGWGGFELMRSGLPLMSAFTVPLPVLPRHLSAATILALEQAGWVALALGSSLASWLLSRRLAGASGIL